MDFKMRKLLLIFIFIIFALAPSFSFANLEELNLYSNAAILIDNETGKVLYSKNENERMYPASTTKILTAILALEHCNLDDVVTINYDVVMSIPEGYSTAKLQVGEEFTVEQLLQLLLVPSANDAANALAYYVGGSLDSFISMMNSKAKDLGLTNSNFTNCYGKHETTHYTTAHDLAILMQYCIKNETFRKIAGSASCAIPATNKYGTRLYPSTNAMLIPENQYYYPYVVAGKTGFTSQAGECLVSVAYKDGLEFIAVVLGGETRNNISARFTDARILYEYGFSNYAQYSIFKSGEIVEQIEVKNGSKDTRNLSLVVADDVSALLKKDVSLSSISPNIILNDEILAPIMEGTVLGTITYSVDGVDYSANLVASHYVEVSKVLDYVIIIGFIFIIFCVICELSSKRRSTK